MLDRLAALPFWQAFAALFVIVLTRSTATYWLGRGATATWLRSRRRSGPATADARQGSATPESEDAHRPDTARTARAELLLRRLGPVAVTLSYLTIGIQTAVHLTAGVMRMPLPLYLPAAVVGSALWAAIYASIGLAVVQAWLAAEAGSWWAVAVLVAVVVAALSAWAVRRRRRAADGQART
jgi:membrane protein DedA with SNARE-associated domain